MGGDEGKGIFLRTTTICVNKPVFVDSLEQCCPTRRLRAACRLISSDPPEKTILIQFVFRKWSNRQNLA